MLVTAVRTMTGGSLLVGRTQVYLLTAEVDADEEAYADAESHYAYSFNCIPERALTRSDFIQR